MGPLARHRSGRNAVVLLLCAFSTVLLSPASCKAVVVDVPVEQAFGGRHYSPAGRLTGDLNGQGFGGVQLQRSAWEPEHRAAFRQLAAEDGFYRLRLKPAMSDAYVTASLRARCLLAARFEERLSLHVGSDGSISGLEYDVPSGACPPGLPLDAGSGKAEGAAPPASPIPVAVRQPASAPRIILTEFESGIPLGDQFVAKAAPAGKDGNQQQQQQQQQQGQKDGKPPPPPDERTWIQKNWLFLLPIGFIILNALSTAQQEPQAAGGQAAARR